MQEIEKAEQDKMKAKVDKICATGCNVIINRQLIYNYPDELFKKNKVDYVKGHGTLTGPNSLSVDLLEGGSQDIAAKNIMLATGSDIVSLPGVEIDEETIVPDSSDATMEQQ